MPAEYESALLGAVLSVPATIDDLALEADLFASPDLRRIFEAVKNLRIRGLRLDDMSLAAELQAAGDGSLVATAIGFPKYSAANARFYRDALAEEGRRGKLTAALRGALEDMENPIRPVAETVDALERSIVASVRGVDEIGDARTGALLPGYLRSVERLALEAKAGKDGIVAMGIPPLDGMLGTIRPGELIVIAARTGCGKTALVLQAAAYCALALHRGTAFFSLEMRRTELLDRLIAQRSGFTTGRLRVGGLGERDYPELLEAAEELRTAPLALYEGRHTLPLLLARMRRERASHGLHVVALDYLGLLDLGSGREAQLWERIGEATRTLKTEALEHGLVILLAVQLNREADGNAEPRLSHLRGSGSVEQDADRVILLHRPAELGPVSAIIAKNRHGRVGRVDLTFDGAHARFE